MKTDLRTLDLSNVANWGHTYAIRAEKSTYLLDLQRNARMMRIPNHDARARRGDRTWQQLDALYACDDAGNPRAELTVRVGDRHYWERTGGRYLIQTPCTSIECLTPDRVRDILTCGTQPTAQPDMARGRGQQRAELNGWFTCAKCRARRPSSHAVHKQDGKVICRACGTGQTCPKCNGHKNPDFDLCRTCANAKRRSVRAIPVGFEINRRRH